ncbi:PREDICTED: integral membrane protein 2C isoform X1 [Corvus brachyrhynchos]|uniref:integral membrane protein 2C isoform X1 n=1 Tax=Corvus brachyrhynchos TaxID=85066 RepID=UPI0008167D30|nr:PREDICTED: integral membrane protein 2C isoform X1 [Corvus brachyrhynchos]
MGLLVLLLGLVFASMYVYRYFFITQLPRESVFHCGVLYEDSLYSPFKGQLELHEDVKIYIEENYEQINVPVPQFGGSDPADIIHDFQRGLTAYHDITLDKCYVIELNTTIVMPPRNLWELLVNVKKGTYLPQTYIIQEEMIATEHVSDMEQLGSFIYRESPALSCLTPHHSPLWLLQPCWPLHGQRGGFPVGVSLEVFPIQLI